MALLEPAGDMSSGLLRVYELMGPKLYEETFAVDPDTRPASVCLAHTHEGDLRLVIAKQLVHSRGTELVVYEMRSWTKVCLPRVRSFAVGEGVLLTSQKGTL